MNNFETNWYLFIFVLVLSLNVPSQLVLECGLADSWALLSPSPPLCPDQLSLAISAKSRQGATREGAPEGFVASLRNSDSCLSPFLWLLLAQPGVNELTSCVLISLLHLCCRLKNFLNGNSCCSAGKCIRSCWSTDENSVSKREVRIRCGTIYC